MYLEEILSTILTWLSTEGVKLLIGFVVMMIAFWIINVITKRIKVRMLKKQRDATLTNVIFNIFKGLSLMY